MEIGQILTDCEEERTTPVGLLGSIEFRIKEVKRDVHVIPIADKTL